MQKKLQMFIVLSLFLCSCPTQTQPGVDGTGVIAEATLTGRVQDKGTNSGIPGVKVKVEGLEKEATTDNGGYYSVKVPQGTYTLYASGTDIFGEPIEASSTFDSTANDKSTVNIVLERVPVDKLNLFSTHKSGDKEYNSNCQLCHGDRKNEKSLDPDITPFHSMPTHSSQSCVSCHKTVDIFEESGASIRKQVDPETSCKTCHPSYPSFKTKGFTVKTFNYDDWR